MALVVLPASAQDFSLTASSFNPDAVSPGGTSLSNISMVANAGFVGPVALTCSVTAPIQSTSVVLPSCQISPSSLSATGGAFATITTTSSTSTLGYTVTITGTDASGTVTTAGLGLTVLSVSSQFTILVQKAVAPSSVVAGSGAEGTVSVNPLNGYTTPAGGYITLYCSSITPLVTIAPVCSFSYGSGQKGVVISGNTPESATLTITTFGPVVTGSAAHPHKLYALWLGLPILGLAVLGTAADRKRSRKAYGLLALLMICGLLLLIPACASNNNTTTTTPNGITPADTYTFAIVGVDSNGVVSSNTATGSTGPSVTLTVTAPPKQ